MGTVPCSIEVLGVKSEFRYEVGPITPPNNNNKKTWPAAAEETKLDLRVTWPALASLSLSQKFGESQ